jgi:hypothetical protein
VTLQTLWNFAHLPQVVDMGQEEYQRTWQQYINAFAGALIAPGADDVGSPAGKRVVSLPGPAILQHTYNAASGNAAMKVPVMLTVSV